MNNKKMTVKEINIKRFEKINNLKPGTFHNEIKRDILDFARKNNLLTNIIGNNPNIGLDENNIIYLISRIPGHKHKQISLGISINIFI